MFQNRLFNMALMIIIAIALISVVAIYVWQTILPTSNNVIPTEVKSLTADQMVEFSVDTEEITTNLKTKNYIIVRFNITADSKHSKTELEKRMPQVHQIIIKTFAELTPDDIEGQEGLNKLEAKLLNEINEIMQEGKIIQVMITKKALS